MPERVPDGEGGRAWEPESLPGFKSWLPYLLDGLMSLNLTALTKKMGITESTS